MTNTILIEKLQNLIDASGSRRAAASALGITVQHLGEVLKGTRTPGPKLLARLNLMKTVEYREGD